MNRRNLLTFAALAAVLHPGASRAATTDADVCALMAAFFKAGVDSPDSHVGRLALSAAALYREGHTDGFSAVVDRGVSMLQGGAK